MSTNEVDSSPSKEKSTAFAALLPNLARSFAHVYDVVRAIYVQFDKDRIPAVAAGTTFFALLALFPGFASVVSLYGLFADRTTIAKQLNVVARFLPHGAIVVLTTDLERLVEQPSPKIGLAFLVSTIVAVLSASGGFRALVEGLNVAYDTIEQRGFVKRSLVGILMTASAIVLCVLALNLAVAIPLIISQLSMSHQFRQMFSILSWPATFLLSLVALSAAYSYIPCRKERHWHWFTWGSFFAALLWLIGTLVFKWYVLNFGSFDRVYGSAGAIVGFLTWIWLSLVIFLAGAELNRELERRA